MLFFVGWVERGGTQHLLLASASRGPYLQENLVQSQVKSLHPENLKLT